MPKLVSLSTGGRIPPSNLLSLVEYIFSLDITNNISRL